MNLQNPRQLKPMPPEKPNKQPKTSNRGRPRGRPRPEDIEALETKILDAALEEFLEQGYGDAAMARIAKKVGGSKTTLYSRYPSKEDLFRAIIFDQINRASPEAALKSETGPLELQQGLKSFANLMLIHSLQPKQRSINKLMYAESYRFPELGEASAERSNLGIARITDFIEKSANKSAPYSNPQAVAKAFIFMIRGWYIHQLLTNKPISDTEREEWVDQAINTLISSQDNW